MKKNYGFTLIEVIITIIVFAIMWTVILVYLNSSLPSSSERISETRDLRASVSDMEEIASLYNNYLSSNISWDTFKTGLVKNGRVVKIISGDSGTDFEDTPFEVVHVKITADDQTISALFTEY
jgi:prepilin-type N-terminal cleavage/methylation domain-containing protein